MTKKPQPNGGMWSITSDQLTSHAQRELLRELGLRMKGGYEEMIQEQIPERLREILERLAQRENGKDEGEA
ncbi:NepR family anti-sigma factor [Microvirga sp. GCM10011540]|uniref:NepR family anti-sigma factor n=1 Tax=Microvirga sp. GCM10011540 TaxID=3317338 RepID=UPI00360F7C41